MIVSKIIITGQGSMNSLSVLIFGAGASLMTEDFTGLVLIGLLLTEGEVVASVIVESSSILSSDSTALILL